MKRRPDRLQAGQVRADPGHSPAGMLFLQLGHRPISRPLGARRQDDHSPLLEEPVRSCKANASAATGDQRYFILQPHIQDRLSKFCWF